MNVGREWLVDAAGCDPGRLRNPEVVRSLCAQILRDLDLRVVGNGLVHHFPAPGGVTALYLLTESHLACHTYPEHGVATFNLHCCRMRPEWPWESMLAAALSAERVSVRRFDRGEIVDDGRWSAAAGTLGREEVRS
jgi:S-adenosylmethionine decarboxylase